MLPLNRYKIEQHHVEPSLVRESSASEYDSYFHLQEEFNVIIWLHLLAAAALQTKILEKNIIKKHHGKALLKYTELIKGKVVSISLKS